jgi:radical SAM protein with 4Fe4S-binding SPASM domain
MISFAQIDPNGLCNSKCWFCPVAYESNPKVGRVNMSLDILENILSQLDSGRGDFVHPDMEMIFPFHYNEVLLYPNFKEMINLYRKYNFKTSIASNGVNVTEDKIDFIKDNLDIVVEIVLNIPSPFPDQWSELTGMNVKVFNKLINNLNYLSNTKIPVILQVNGVNEDSLMLNGGHLNLLAGAPKINFNKKNGDLATNAKKFKEMFPDFTIVIQDALVDRAGYLQEKNIITNFPTIQSQKNESGTKVVGCSNNGSRPDEWVHISANGDVFLCCNDYNFETIFGNIKDKTLKEIWNSQERINMINKSYSHFCTNCSSAIWG